MRAEVASVSWARSGAGGRPAARRARKAISLHRAEQWRWSGLASRLSGRPQPRQVGRGVAMAGSVARSAAGHRLATDGSRVHLAENKNPASAGFP